VGELGQRLARRVHLARLSVALLAQIRKHVRLDRLTLVVGAALLAATASSWFVVLEANDAMDDSSTAASAPLAQARKPLDTMSTAEAMDADASAAAAMTESAVAAQDREMTAMEMSAPADVRMRLGVSEQMQSWAWPATVTLFFGGWTAMMAAMMLPAASPMVTMYGRSARKLYRPLPAAGLITLFVCGYLLIWGLFGLGAYGINEAVAEAAGRWDRVTDSAPYAGGALLILAGVYQLSPLKQLCLSKCRTPVGFMLTEWRPGAAGALRIGTKHGLFCLGCCVGLMLGLIVAGVMSIGWMLTLGVLIFAEKITRWGPQLSRLTGVVMFAAGLALLIRGENLPGIA